MASLMVIAAMAAHAVVLIAAATGRIAPVTFMGWFAVVNAILALANVLIDSPALASFHAAVGALAAWLWRKGGGGDGTRRRLKRWVRRFEGVRRTAPAAGTA